MKIDWCSKISFLGVVVATQVGVAQAESDTCRANAAGIVAEMRNGEFAEMTKREIEIARHAAFSACEATFSDLETSLAAKSTHAEETGINPEEDPIGWLKEQWSKAPERNPGHDRLKRRLGK